MHTISQQANVFHFSIRPTPILSIFISYHMLVGILPSLLLKLNILLNVGIPLTHSLHILIS